MQTLKSKRLIIYKMLIVIFLFVCLGFPADIEAKLDLSETVANDSYHSPFYVSIKGDKGLTTEGAGKPDSIGNLYIEGHENEIIGLGLSHGVRIPMDETGKPTGPPIHNQLSIAKYFDSCGPLLYQALIKGEKLIVEIKFYRTNFEGTSEHYFTIILEDAVIVDISSGSDIRYESGISLYKHTEEVSFVYEKIIWKHEITGTESSDKWNSGLF